MSVSSGTRPDAVRRDDAVARFRALAGIARVGTGTVSSVLAEVAEAARLALAAASASLSVFEPDKGQVRCLVNVGELGPDEVPEPADEVYSLLDFGNLGMLVEGQHGVMVHVDQEDQSDDYVGLLRAYGKASCISVPVPLDGKVWGELFVTRGFDDLPFDDVDLDFAVAVAAQVGAAIATAEHVGRVAKLAYTDALTGLANRRAVDQWLDEAFARYASDGTSVGLMVCDLNGLKRLNDEHGHDVGDRALVRFAGLLSAAAAHVPGALAGRLGGDEFCVAVSGVPADDLVAAAEELCRLVRRSPLEGVSCGVAATDDEVGPVETSGRLFRLADAAQYRAKRSRSSQPVVAGRSLPPEAAVQLADHPLHPVDRRLLRGREVVDSGRLLRAGLEVLDDLPADAVQERLVALADSIAHRVDALGWWLSVARAGGDVVETVRFSLMRTRPATDRGLPAWAGVGERFALADYPLTVSMLAGGAAVVLVEDPSADPAEVAVLDGMGAVGVCLAGARQPDGTGWLLELFADELTAPTSELAAAVRLLVLEAVVGGAPPG
jgi:diguanylate cyclase (GGDEF)-like protein